MPTSAEPPPKSSTRLPRTACGLCRSHGASALPPAQAKAQYGSCWQKSAICPASSCRWVFCRCSKCRVSPLSGRCCGCRLAPGSFNACCRRNRLPVGIALLVLGDFFQVVARFVFGVVAHYAPVHFGGRQFINTLDGFFAVFMKGFQQVAGATVVGSDDAVFPCQRVAHVAQVGVAQNG